MKAKRMHLSQILTAAIFATSSFGAGAQEAVGGSRELQANTAAIAQMMDAKNSAVMSILQAMTKCQAKLKFYKPGAGADADGCQPSAARLKKSVQIAVSSSDDNSGTASNGIHYTENSSGPHQLCVLRQISSWGKAFWGQCRVNGNPGGVWTVRVDKYNSSITCGMVCYDFQ